ncbi:hypothetical protein [Microbacterium trichothecenolyticum]|uniref:hypothetical protein n=1 Tax=Microbacterium trichothecenolyticum TaxID=69370 RepID=UPI0027D7B62E|nr:hypothetical protein [Microbacterium trichothecenolyticum]
MAASVPDDAFHVDVDITPLPTPPPSPTPSPSQLPDHGWLALTGIDPAWIVAGGALLLLAVGVALVVAARRGA